MENTKLQIELNHRSYGKDVLYVAVSLRGGYITKNFIRNDNTLFQSNYAFFNVLFHYFRIASETAGLHYDVQRAASTISFCAKKAEVLSVLNQVLATLFNDKYNRENFENAKQATKNAFAARYKEGKFRAQYKAYEFSDLNKRFTLQGLIDDMERIDFAAFQTCAKELLVPGNICVYISGETDHLNFESLKLTLENRTESQRLLVAGYNFNPYLRQDAHITNIAREDYNLVIEAFDFINPDITNFTKLLIVEILAQTLPVRDAEVWVDSLDASIFVPARNLLSHKQTLSVVDEAMYYRAKKSLITNYIILMEKNPEHFAMKAAGLMLVGIYVDQYLGFLDICSFEMFKEICEKADYKISEAQISLRKESN